ncbi:hypothetical protein BVY00_01280 [bacterium G20]|nr:hypothetical protein BVY00_01280 [bacterium G20]
MGSYNLPSLTSVPPPKTPWTSWLTRRPYAVALSFAALIVLVTSILGLGKALHSSPSPASPSSPLASQTDQALSADSTSTTITLNLDTVLATGKKLTLGQIVADPSSGVLQLTGDLQASGTLRASGGSTSLNNDGLVINKVTVCTVAGCIPNPRINPVTGSSGTAAPAGLSALPPTTTLQGNSFNGPSQLVQLTTAGALPALNAAALIAVNAVSLQGNNSSFYTNATNLSSGTLSDARLSVNATLQGNTFNNASQLVQLNSSSQLPAVSGVNLTNLNATSVASGTLADARLSANVALLAGTGPQTFTGNNKFTGTFLAQNAANSTSAFAIQNAAGSSNLLIADTTSNRIAIGQTTAAYTLDVNGDINSTTGIRVGGSLLCSGSGCTAAAGSTSYIQNSLNLQTANFNIQSGATTSATGIIRAATSQTADLLQLKDSSGTNVATIGPAGNTLIQPSTNSINAFSLKNAAGTSLLIGGDTLNARVAIATAVPPNYTLDVGGDINTSTGLRVAGNLVCSTTCTPGSGSGSYVQNGTAVQTANYAIQSAVGSSIVAYIRGASGQSADLLDVVGIGAANAILPVATFSASGNILFQNAIDSTTAFRVQNLAGTNQLVVDTTNQKVAVGPSGVPANGVLTIGTNTTAATGGIYFGTDTNLYRGAATQLQTDSQLNVGKNVIVGNADATSKLYFGASQDTNLYRGAASQLKTDSTVLVQPTTNSTTAFRIQNTAGTNLFVTDTTNGQVAVGSSAVPANGALTIGSNSSTATGGLYFGTDTNLYRSAANRLTTDSALTVAGADLTVNGGTGNIILNNKSSATTNVLKSALSIDNFFRFQFDASGKLEWGSGALAVDTNLYRGAASQLKTDSTVLIQPTTNSTTAFQVQNAAGTSNLLVADTTNTKIGIGKTPSAGGATLQVSGSVDATSSFTINGTSINTAGTLNNVAYLNGTGPQIFTGNNKFTGTLLHQNAADSTTAFRIQNAAGTNLLVTDTTNSQLAVGPSGVPANGVLTIGTNTTAATGGIYFGTDTNLYRSFTSTLTTDYSLEARLGNAGAISTGTSSYNALLGKLQNLTVTGNVNSLTAGSFGVGTLIVNASNTLSDLYGVSAGLGGTYTINGTVSTAITGAFSGPTTVGTKRVSLQASDPAGGTTNINLMVGNEGGLPASGTYGIYQSTANSNVLAGNTRIGSTASPTVTLDVAGNALFKNGSDSTTAFQVQNAAGSNLVQVDTSNANITLNGVNTGLLQTWSANTNALPAVRYGHTSVVANGYVYGIGGTNGSATQSTVYYAKLNGDGSTGTWSTNTNALPAARSYPSSVTANGYVYVLGGSDGSTAQSTVYYAKLNSDGSIGSWTTNSNSLPAIRQEASAVTANGYVYMLGGSDGTTAQSTVYYAKLNSDGSTGTWTTNANALTAGRFDASSVVANGYVYFIGGNNVSAQSTVYYAKLNSDGSTGTWTTNANALPATTAQHTSVVANGYVYVVGGGGTTVYYAKLNSDGSTGTWTTNANALPASRSLHSSVITNGYVYVLGGNNAGAQTTVYYASTSRLKVGGSLDLIGLPGQTLADPGDPSAGSSGGSVIAGNITAIGSLQAQGQGSFSQGLSANGNLTVGGSALFQNSANSTTAFQIQNVAGTSLFTVDTTNSTITLGPAGATPIVLVLGNKNTAGDPTCTAGGLYYNSNTTQIRGCLNGAWNNLAGTNTGTTIPTTNLYDGRTFRLRTGSTPFEFLDLVYDSTYAKWVSAAFPMVNIDLQSSTTSATYVALVGSTSNETAVSNHKALYDAGLRLQLYHEAYFDRSGVGITSFGSVKLLEYTSGDANTGTVIASGQAEISSGNSSVRVSSGWVAVTYSPAPTKDFVIAIIEQKQSGGGTAFYGTSGGGSVRGRWVSL